MAANLLISSFTSSLGSSLTDGRVQQMCAAIAGQQLLAEAGLHGASSAARQQASQAVDQWLEGLLKLLQQADQASVQAHAAALLGASLAACDAQRLLQHYTTWAAFLLDRLKQQVQTLLQCAHAQPPQPAAAMTMSRAVQAACDTLQVLFARCVCRQAVHTLHAPSHASHP